MSIIPKPKVYTQKWGVDHGYYKQEEMDHYLENLDKRHKTKIKHLVEDIEQVTDTMQEHRDARDEAEGKLKAAKNWWYGEAQRFSSKDARISFRLSRFNELKEILGAEE